MKTMLISLVYYTLLACLAIGVFYPSPGLVSLSVAAYWMLLLVAFPCALIIMGVSISYDALPEKLKPSVAKILIQSAKKRSFPRRLMGWLQLLIILAFLAYSGWIFTALFYWITSMICRFSSSISHDAVARQGLA